MSFDTAFWLAIIWCLAQMVINYDLRKRVKRLEKRLGQIETIDRVKIDEHGYITHIERSYQ